MDYKQSGPYSTPAYIVKPSTETVKGVHVKRYPAAETGELIYCKFKSYGGTETSVNGVTAVEDTANVETWYRPDITSDCGFCLASNPLKVYEILGEPENVEQRNLILKFKVRAVNGGA